MAGGAMTEGDSGDLWAAPDEITDREGGRYQVGADVYNGGLLRVSLFSRTVRGPVGKLEALVEGGQLLISDLVVVSNALKREGRPVKLTRWVLRIPPPRIDFQGRGLGTRLLEMAIDFGRARGLRYVTGFVVRRDLEANPDLLNWYKRRGFDVYCDVEPGLIDKVADLVMNLRKAIVAD